MEEKKCFCSSLVWHDDNLNEYKRLNSFVLAEFARQRLSSDHQRHCSRFLTRTVWNLRKKQFIVLYFYIHSLGKDRRLLTQFKWVYVWSPLGLVFITLYKVLIGAGICWFGRNSEQQTYNQLLKLRNFFTDKMVAQLISMNCTFLLSIHSKLMNHK